MSADNSRVQIGVATFDTTVHFYSLAASQSQAQMLVMPDIEDVYSLAAANVVVPLQESFQLVSISSALLCHSAHARMMTCFCLR